MDSVEVGSASDAGQKREQQIKVLMRVSIEGFQPKCWEKASGEDLRRLNKNKTNPGVARGFPKSNDRICSVEGEVNHSHVRRCDGSMTSTNWK